AALGVGGETRFHRLPLQGLKIDPEMMVLDLCCGSGQATKFLVKFCNNVTGLDVSLVSLKRAQTNVPEASYVEAAAEEMPFPDNNFDLVHTSVALHEMKPSQLQTIINEVYRVLKPGGVFALVDFHKPTNLLFWPGLALFLQLFETETAWQLLDTDLIGLLKDIGFQVSNHTLHAGGSLQVIQVSK
ncbi:MAG: class I SAM-dependent methyltransferase, partial [Symploca sp. SIO1A3]|nr:class I SAM-dependent methyltransferase [Symploca sp. SIO1A3]